METDIYSASTPEDLIYTLLQRGADAFFSFLDELEDRSEALEQRLFEGQKGYRRFSKPEPMKNRDTARSSPCGGR